MVDFEGGKRGGFEPDTGSDESLNTGSNSLQKTGASNSNGTRVLTADANGVVVLPAGVSLEDIEVVGRDLVINLADGSRIVIPDGAIIVPQLVIDGVAVPPLNLAALLNDAEINPEAQPNQPPSSGGNFAGEVGDIQDAFDLGNLLPYTDLARVLEEEEEVLPFENTEPNVVIETPENPVGVPNAIATVSEDGLPARGDEPEGTAEETDSEVSNGTIVIDAPDGLSAVIINGVEVTTPGQTITTDLGTLEITSIDLDTGEIGFIYTLEDNTTTPGTNDNFDVTVVDRDGDEADATLTVIIEDDAPIAINDANTVPPGSFEPVTGNVVDNDESGADGFPPEGAVTGFSNANGSAEPGDTLQGEYGTLTLNPDGSYSYTRDFNTPGGVSEDFTYTIVDQDGSTATAVLTINIEDSPADITFVPDTGDGTVVEEDALPPRGDEPVGSDEGSDGDPDNNSDPNENTGNTITFTSPDGVGSITIDGVEVNLDNQGGDDSDDQVIIDNETGTLIITEVTYDPETGEGTITYDFTLNDNTDGDDTSVDFDIVVTDLDGDSAEDTVTITIVDDVPEAIDDTASQDAENAPITVDVFVNDVEGADGVPFENIEVVEGSLTGTGTLVNNGDGTFTYTPGPGEEGDDDGQITFEYTITDNDGDSDTATVTIDLLPDSTPEIGAEGEDTASEDGLPARGDEPAGSNEASDSETTSGSIVIDTGNDTIASLVINGVDVTNGGTVTTDKGELVVTEDNGAYTYEYTLTDNTLTDPDSDPFEVVVTDSDGDSATTNIVIAIIDDMPEAVDDANSIAAGEYGPIGGNVIDNDTQGADGAVVSTFEGNGNTGAPGDTIQGVYGTLTLNEDGTYTYVRDAGTPGGVTDTFEYTITDGDGDTSSANLVITIGDSDVELMVPAAGDDGTQVDEAGLDSPVGSDAGSDSELTSGTITYDAPDGPATVTIGGVEITAPGQTIVGTFGTMTITSVAEGVIEYTYELTTNTDGDDTEDSFDVVVTDQDGDDANGTVVIDIIDDVPTANPDSDSVTEDGPLVADGNVLTGAGGADANTTDGVEDVQGADGATVTGVAFGDTGTDVSGDVGTAVSGNYGELTINADGSYTYELDNTNPLVQGLDSDDTLTETFTYTITDGDTDTSTTTATITVNGADDDVTVNDLEVEFAELVVDEDDLADGSSPDAAGLTQGSSFTVDSQDGLDDVTIGGVDVVVDGVFVGAPVVIIGDYGTLTITGYTPVTDAAGDTVSATFDYEYVLSDNTLDHSAAGEDNVLDSFAVVATDTDGSTDNGSLDVAVVDDVPTAEDDTDSISEASGLTSTDGNVITGVGTDSGAAGEDTEGADTAVVSTTGDFVGTYGTLTLNADGSYDYVLSQFGIDTMNALSDGESVSEDFPYTLTDADGDSDDATLTFTLNGENDIVTINDLDGQGPELIVDEDDLADGSSPDAAALTQGSAFTFTSPDGLDDVTIGGVDVIVDGVFVGPVTVTGTYGELTITGFTPVTDAAGNVTSGGFDYEYELSNNTLDHSAATGEDSLFDDFEVVATDDDGDTDSAFINVEVVDDVPTAEDDTDSISEASGLTSTDGNVITGVGTDSGAAGEDTEGADTAVVSTTGDFVGTYGTLTLNADGSYDYVLSQFGIDTMNALSDGESVSEDFPYTLTDADGDSDDATLTFTLNGENDIVTINDLDGQGPELVVDEDDLLPNGSDQSDSTTDGDTFTFDSPDGLEDVTIGGVDVIIDGVFQGAPNVVISGDYGNLTITGFTPVTDTAGNITGGSFDYEYTITTNTLDHDGAGEDSLFDNFEVVATDDDGDSDSAFINVEVVDDVPTAEDDADSVGEGETADGNLVTGIGGSDANTTDGEADVLGADGAAAGGAVVDADFVSGEQGITFVSKNVAGDGTVTITTTAGVLTVNSDGTYEFASAANSINADAEIVFEYTIEDGDGDQDVATLTIDIANVAGQVSATAINVDEKGLEDGSGELADPAPNTDQSEIDSGQITVVNATGPFVYDLVGSVAGPGANEVQVDGVYGTIVLNTQTGAYTYTLDTEFAHDPVQGTNVELAAESFTFTVEDAANNDIGTGTINVNITDDIPSVELDFSGNGGATLLTQDAQTEGADFDTATGQFAGAFAVTSSVYGADGAGSLDTTYDLTLLAAAGTDTGLDSNGASIFIYELADGTIVGSTSNVAPASVDATVIFSLAVDEGSGEVTLTQFAEIDHPIADDPSATETPFEDQIADLADNLVGLTATAEIIDADGDTDSSSETLDLGGLVQFADDGPTIDAQVTDSAQNVLVTFDENTEGTNSDVATSAANFGGAFSVDSFDYGADGAGTIAWDFSFDITDANSGLSSDGDPITLFLIGGKVVGSTATDAIDVDPSNTIFDLAVEATSGVVTLTQYTELDHPDNNDTSAPYNDQLLALADDKIDLVGEATITDGDGDTASETVTLDLGGNVKFADDGPSVTAVADTSATVTIDETNLAEAAGAIDLGATYTQGSDSDVGSDPTLIGGATTDGVLVVTPDFGADGEKDGGGLTYELAATDGTPSGLSTTDGTAINLFQVSPSVVVGVIAGTTTAAFAVEIDATTGEVSVEQYVSLFNPNAMNPNDPVQLADGSLSATVTATDGDDDDATSAEVDITDLITFLDDGPTINVTKGAEAGVELLTQDAETDGVPTETDTATSTANFGGVFGVTSTAGADGAVDPVLTYALAVTDSASGLTSGGDAINLFVVGGVVVGSTAADAGSVNPGNTIFDISVAANGAVTVNQYEAIDHPIADDPSATEAPFEDQIISLADGKVTLTANSTITDGDGDQATDSETVDLGGNIQFADDGPIAVNDTDTVTEGRTGAGNVLNGSGTTSGAAGIDSSGADGFGTPTVIGIASVNVGGSDIVADGSGNYILVGEFGTLTMGENGTYFYDSNPDSVTASGETDVFEYTIIDSDGDTSTATLTITINDTTLVADNDTIEVNEAGLDVIGSDAASNSETAGGTLNVSEAVSYTLVGNGVGSNGTLTLNTTTGAYEYTLTSPVDGDSLNPSQGGDNNTNTYLGLESFDYIATDAFGNTVQGTITIDVIDDVPTANDDSDTIAAGGTEAAGNVITGVGTDNPVTGEDVQGADQPVSIASLVNGDTGQSDNDGTDGYLVEGLYGTLDMAADGSYTYTRFDGSAGGVEDVFTYTIVDQDGDTSMATLTIDIGDLTPTAPDSLAQLDDDGLAGANTAAGTNDIDADAIDMNGNEAIFSGSLGGSGGDGALAYVWTQPAPTTIGQEGVSFTLTNGGLTLTAVITTGARAGTNLFEAVITDAATGAFAVTLLQNVLHVDDANDDEDGTEITTILGYSVSDVDGDSDTGAVLVEFNDDVPTLGPILDQSTTNEPTDPVVVGDLELSAGADGLGELTVTADVTGLTVGGQSLFTQQIGDVLYAYADDDGIIDGDETVVFTITVDPDAGGTGTYTFDLVTPLDGVVSDVPIGGSTAFGAGPEEQGQALDDGAGEILSVVSGYNTLGSFDPVDWFATGNFDPSDLETGGVNGSTSGWGIDNNNFNESQFFVWDFSSGPLEDPDGPGGFVPPPAVTLPDVTFATFDFKGASASEEVQLIVRFTDGSFAPVTVTGPDLTSIYTYTAPAGKFIDSIEMYGETLGGGGTKVQLVSVGVQDESIDVDIPVKVTAVDGDGDMVMSEFDINISDEVPAISNLVASINGGEGSLDEDDLANGSEFPGDSTLLNGTFNISAPDGVGDLIVGGETVISGGTFVGGSITTSLGTLNIISYDAGSGEVTYTYQLDSNADHSGGDVFDNVAVQLTDTDGDADGDTLSVKIVDDAPVPTGDVNVTTETVGDVNVLFVLDFSGSVNNTELNQMLKGVEESLDALYGGTSGDVTVRFVAFSNAARDYGPFTDAASAIAQLDALNPAEGGTRPYSSTTNYSAAINETIASFVPEAGAENRIFFLSDGNPNRGRGPNGETLNSTAETAWDNFINSNPSGEEIGVISIGIGDNINTGPLADVDVDGEGSPIIVANFTEIAEALLSEIRPDPVSGDLDGNDLEGADGARVLSIEVDGVTYTWDGAASVTPSDGGAVIAGTAISVDTALGGTLDFNFATGEYSYRPPNEVNATTDEQFDYVLVDGDGSTSGATLTVTVQDAADVGMLSAMSFASSTMLVGDSGVPGGDSGSGGGSTFSFANDNFSNQIGMRSFTTSMTATAAFGAMMVNSGEMSASFGNASVSSYDAYSFGGLSSFEMVSMDSLGGFSSPIVSDWMPSVQSPVSVNTDGKFGDYDAFTNWGLADLADFRADSFDFGGVSDFLAESAAFDAAAPMMGGMDTSGSMMEALLALTPQPTGEVELADVAGLGIGSELPKLAAIMEDIMAENAIDAMLDQFATPTNEIVGMDSETGYLGNDALAAMIDTGAFAFDGGAMADMSEEAAALAVMSA
ncbi:hypothetical protein BPTFM16_01308 [Altererythrobacter insulae]|nr:hypothetical protein BPTFM16_01308 [Altererythrobacter insulae]